MKETQKPWLSRMLLLTTLIGFFGCGGGGGGSSTVLYYPYETVFGTVCSTFEPVPGCTFDRRTGQRISVSHDPHYNRFGGQSDDMWFVEFDDQGYGYVYNYQGVLQSVRYVSDFAGWVGGTYIGVGTTGLYWEDIRNGTYWLGKNGVLYSANIFERNFGRAINEDGAEETTNMSLASYRSQANQALIRRAADKLVKDFRIPKDRATAIAASLNAFALAAVERGHVTTTDIDSTFKAVFGVHFNEALKAVNDLRRGEKQAMREITKESAKHLGIQPHEAQRFVKEMYRNALTDFGYSVDDINW